MNELHIFLSYAPDDIFYRDGFAKEFSPWMRNKDWTMWHDGQILAGAIWKDEVKKNLEQADVIILLVNSNFINSEHINDVELREALSKKNKGSALVVPIILDDCGWQEYDELPEIKAVKINDKIRSKKDDEDVKFALQDAAKQVFEALKTYKPAKYNAGKLSLPLPLKPTEIAELRQLDPAALVIAVRQKQDVCLLLPKSEIASQHALSPSGLPQKVLAILQRLLLKGDIEDEDCRALGEALFCRLFSDAPAQEFFIRAYQDHAPKDGKPLKIVLHFDEQSNDLAGLPWEYLWLPLPDGAEEGFFIGEKENLVLTRRLAVAAGSNEKKVEADKLRILVAYSKPKTQEIAQRIEADASEVFARSQPQKEEGKRLWANITVLGPQEFKSKTALENFAQKEEQFHIVHFVGKGKTEDGKSSIAFCDAAAQKEEWLSPDEFVKCFPADKKPNLIFLHAPPDSCRSLRDMALNLVTSVDGVIAIQTPVKSEEAADFSEKLYTALAKGEYLDEAVTHAAQFVAATSANRLRMYGISASFSRATLKMEVAKQHAVASLEQVPVINWAVKLWCPTALEDRQKCGQSYLLLENGEPEKVRCRQCEAYPLWKCPSPGCDRLTVLDKTAYCACGKSKIEDLAKTYKLPPKALDMMGIPSAESSTDEFPGAANPNTRPHGTGVGGRR